MPKHEPSPGVTLENYGSVWHIEHRVAKCWYADDEDDVRRCWSLKNVVPDFASNNYRKGITIIDHVCDEVGSDHWPKSWNGAIPDEATKKSMYKKMRANVPVPTSRPVSAQADGSHMSEDEDWF